MNDLITYNNQKVQKIVTIRDIQNNFSVKKVDDDEESVVEYDQTKNQGETTLTDEGGSLKRPTSIANAANHKSTLLADRSPAKKTLNASINLNE